MNVKSLIHISSCQDRSCQHRAKNPLIKHCLDISWTPKTRDPNQIVRLAKKRIAEFEEAMKRERKLEREVKLYNAFHMDKDNGGSY